MANKLEFALTIAHTGLATANSLLVTESKKALALANKFGSSDPEKDIARKKLISKSNKLAEIAKAIQVADNAITTYLTAEEE